MQIFLRLNGLRMEATSQYSSIRPVLFATPGMPPLGCMGCTVAAVPSTGAWMNGMPTVANTIFWRCDDHIITHRSLDYVNVYRKHDVVPAGAASPAAEAAVKLIIDHAYFLAIEKPHLAGKLLPAR
jgi:hypothetical protein